MHLKEVDTMNSEEPVLHDHIWHSGKIMTIEIMSRSLKISGNRQRNMYLRKTFHLN